MAKFSRVNPQLFLTSSFISHVAPYFRTAVRCSVVTVIQKALFCIVFEMTFKWDGFTVSITERLHQNNVSLQIDECSHGKTYWDQCGWENHANTIASVLLFPRRRRGSLSLDSFHVQTAGTALRILNPLPHDGAKTNCSWKTGLLISHPAFKLWKYHPLILITSF